MTEDLGTNFVRDMIAAEIAAAPERNRVATRFPPEPNGYLHIGHAKSICLNFGLAEEFGGTCNLRFDDTNPTKEEVEYVDSIKEDVRWLGYSWGDREYYASDYFEQLYAWAELLVQQGDAYVDSLDPEQIREFRGDFHKPGRNSPYRDRPVAESLDLLRRMRAGEFPEGAHVLRAKIDMTHGNLNMRDPPLYRIKRAHHHRTGDAWCIYPMYDFAHGQSDALEHITHSICTLEFEAHRPLYDWLIEKLPVPSRPRQTEFGRLRLTYTVLSKRKLRRLVEEGFVDGWSDPRMPTLSAMRRRGYSPEAIRNFCERIGVSRRDGVVDFSLLEHALREDLNEHSPRVMGVLRPLRVVLENFPDDHVEWFDAPYFPEDPSRGSRPVPLTRVLYVERDDFLERAPKKWFRLTPGQEVRLRYGGLITCGNPVKDERGEIIELRCTWDPQSKGGATPDGRRVRGTLHWVSAEHAVRAEVRLYDRLFTEAELEQSGRDFIEALNPRSLEILENCYLEPALRHTQPLERFQFERLGYFCVDPQSRSDKLIFNRTIGLRDSWGKIATQTGSTQADSDAG